MEKIKMLLIGSTTIHPGFHISGIPQLCEQCDSIGQTKEIMVYARGTTASKTTLRTSLVLIWFDDSPHSNQMIDKTIGPATDHRDQSMKISSFLNTHYTRISLWNELSQTSFYLPTLQVVVQLNQLAQGYLTPILGKKVVHKKPTWSRAQHNGQVTTW